MKKMRNEVAVGTFVIVALLILTVSLFLVSGVYLFRSGTHIHIMYDYVSILDRGAPVRMAGVRIGEVSGVTLLHNEDTGNTRVRVKLFIEKGVEIRENYVFKIQGTHILSEPHIEISPQPGNAPLVTEGMVIEGEGPVPVEELLTRAHEIAGDLEGILSSIRQSVENEATGKSIQQILTNLGELTESLNTVVSGSEADLKSAIKNLSSATEALTVSLEQVKAGQGTAGKLIYDEELYQEIRAFVAEIKAHPWRLLKKDGERSRFLGIF